MQIVHAMQSLIACSNLWSTEQRFLALLHQRHSNVQHPRPSFLFHSHQWSIEVTDLAARELVVLLQGVRRPLPLLVPGLCPPLCPLLSLWEEGGELKASGVWLSGSILTRPERRRRETGRNNGHAAVRTPAFHITTVH